MNQPTSPPEICLRSLLSAGPRNSRDVLAAMTALQFTPKQVRRARERQGIVVERSGNGADMHSTWRLPDDPDDENNSAVAAAFPDVGADVPLHGRYYGACGDAPCTSDAPAMRRAAACLNEGERRRHQSRVAAFTARGIDALMAWQVADALVARDRDGLRATGSCAECQCPALNSCPTVPRPAAEIHECWHRRQCTP